MQRGGTIDNSYHRPVYYSRQQRTFRGRVARGSVFLRKMVCRAVAEFDIQWRSKAINSRQRGSLRVAPLLMRTYRAAAVLNCSAIESCGQFAERPGIDRLVNSIIRRTVSCAQIASSKCLQMIGIGFGNVARGVDLAAL